MRKLLIVFICFLIFTKSYAGISVVNGLSHSHKMIAGEISKGIIEIKNTGLDVERVKIFKTDFQYNSQGQTFYNPPSSYPRSNADWIQLGASEVSIQPGDTYLLPYQVLAPDSLAMAGSFWSVVMIEPIAEGVAEKAQHSIGLTTKVRYAVQVVCNFEGSLKADVQFKSAVLDYPQGKKLLLVDLEDTGDLYHKVILSAEFFNSETGENLGIYFSPTQSLHPGNSKRFIIDVGKLPDGEYQAVLLAVCEDENVFGVNVDVKIASEEKMSR